MIRNSLILALLLLTGCAPKPMKPVAGVPPAPAPGSLATTREFVDLAPDWRLQIVAPVTKSGSFEVKTEAPSQQSGNVISLKSSNDLIGYETASWSLRARPGGGVSLKLSSAEMNKDGQTTAIPIATRALIHVPKYARFLRVFYLTRQSAADHDMAILGARRFDQLDPLTAKLRTAPNEACANQPRERVYCEWIPAGMAVRPESPKVVNGETRWASPF